MEANQHEHKPEPEPERGGRVGHGEGNGPRTERERAVQPEALPVFGGATLTADFVEALPELAIEWRAAKVPDPHLLVLNDDLARDLQLDPGDLRSESGAQFLVGRALAAGSRPAAQLYAGHQFGGYSPLLGDGRALLLGEIRCEDGTLRDLHLKGSGRTPPARGDGFAAVGPMLREYLVSEAMHALGIPTTRALAVTATGRRVLRDDFLHDNLLPGAVLTRVAASHLRVGTFQYARATRNADLLRRLVRFAIHRHAPHLELSETPALDLLREVVRRQAELVASWTLVGFVHGVMNTDNMTISGETIDYGPCAFIDAYDPGAVFSSIDHEGRYAFANQRAVAKWNLARFAESLLPMLISECGSGAAVGGAAARGISGPEPEPEPYADGAANAAGGAAEPDADPQLAAAAQDAAIAAATGALAEFDGIFDAAWVAGMRAKLGLVDAAAGGLVVAELARDLLKHMRDTGADYTGTFRALARIAEAERLQRAAVDRGSSHAASPDLAVDVMAVEPRLTFPEQWIARWLALGPDSDAMNRVNPIYIPRNHLLDAALEAATDGDLAPFTALLARVTRPFEEQPGAAEYTSPAPPGAGRFITYCGT